MERMILHMWDEISTRPGTVYMIVVKPLSDFRVILRVREDQRIREALRVNEHFSMDRNVRI